MYDKGEGVAQDFLKARECYELAAKQGHTGAQYNLAHMYLKGDGGEKNLMISKEYFRQACDSGSQKGCDDYKRLNKSEE